VQGHLIAASLPTIWYPENRRSSVWVPRRYRAPELDRSPPWLHQRRL